MRLGCLPGTPGLETFFLKRSIMSGALARPVFPRCLRFGAGKDFVGLRAPRSRKASPGEVTPRHRETKAEAGEAAPDVARQVRAGIGSLSNLWSSAYAVLEHLRQAGIGVAWIGEGLRSLSDREAALGRKAAAGEPVSPQIEALAADLAAFHALTQRAAELAGKLGETRSRIAAEEERLAALRREMSLPLEGADPAERLAGAAGLADDAADLLGAGGVDDAMVVLEQAGWQVMEAVALLLRLRHAGPARGSTKAGERHSSR